MRIYVAAVRDALATRNWLAALALALSLPDICGGCETPGQKNSRSRYVRWFEKWVQPEYTGMQRSAVARVGLLQMPDGLTADEQKAMVNAHYAPIRAAMAAPPAPHVFLSGSDCYALRCAVTHRGSDQADRRAADDALKRFSFVVSGPNMYQHNNKYGDMLCLDVPTFASHICDAVEAWDIDTIGDAAICAEKAKLMQIIQL